MSSDRRRPRDRSSRAGTFNSTPSSISDALPPGSVAPLQGLDVYTTTGNTDLPPGLSADQGRGQFPYIDRQQRQPIRRDEVNATGMGPSNQRTPTQRRGAGDSSTDLRAPATSSRQSTRQSSRAPSLAGPSGQNVSSTSFRSFPMPATPSINSAWSAGIRPPSWTPQEDQDAADQGFEHPFFRQGSSTSFARPLPPGLAWQTTIDSDLESDTSLPTYRSRLAQGEQIVPTPRPRPPPGYEHPPGYVTPPQPRTEEVEESIEESPQQQPTGVWICCGGQGTPGKRTFGLKKRSTRSKCGTVNYREHGKKCSKCGHERCLGCEYGTMKGEPRQPPDDGRSRGPDDDRGGSGGGKGGSGSKGKCKEASKPGLFGRMSPSRRRART